MGNFLSIHDVFCFPLGARVGDEILIINGAVVANLHHRCIESLFAENHLILTVRRFSSDWTQTVTGGNDALNQITIPPPPGQSKLLEEFVDNHLLPVPSGEFLAFFLTARQ